MRRRDFLATALAARSVWGANERLRVGVIGTGGRGQLLASEFKELGAEVVAVCDVYEPHLEAGLKAASTGARAFKDYRKLLELKDLDAVVIATPDHWHARMAIDAVEAGKDVYLEKPMAHTIEEAFAIVEATRRTRRIVQIGTQRRSYELFLRARECMQQVGEVRLVTSWWMNYQRGLTERPFRGAIDWRSWLGPAPECPPDPKRFFNWYYFWDYSGGMMVGQGAHVIDAINWFMNSTFPFAATCAATQPNLPGAEVPETTSLTLLYPENFLVVFSVGYRAMRYNRFNDQIKQFHGDRARLDVGREWFSLYPQSLDVDMKPSISERQPGSFDSATRAHIRNFIDCVRSRKEPNAPVEAGLWTTVALVMAVESLRRGCQVRFNPSKRALET